MMKFISNNPAKDYRDKILSLYDELISIKINNHLSEKEKEKNCRSFMTKVATQALNRLGDERESFVSKYLQKYHSKISNKSTPNK